MFPAGILQPPFFYPEGDDAINYGAIGAVIGHEITHGFDNSGRKFDAQGNQVDWWTAEDAKNVRRAGEVHHRAVQRLLRRARGSHQNGELVQGESIADLGGLTIAYRAFQKSLEGKPAPPPIDGLTATSGSSSRAPGLGVEPPPGVRAADRADERAPARDSSARWAPSRTCRSSQKAFGCATGSAMVREPRCQIW